LRNQPWMSSKKTKGGKTAGKKRVGTVKKKTVRPGGQRGFHNRKKNKTPLSSGTWGR